MISLILRLFTVCCAAAWMLLLPAAAFSAPVRLDQYFAEIPIGRAIEYIEDPDGTLSFDTVAHDKYLKWVRSARTNPGFGFTSSTYWVRFDVANTTRDDIPFLLEHAYPLMDDIQLYYPDAGGTYRIIETGDRIPFDKRPYDHRQFVFPLTQKGDSVQRYYMRLRSTSSMSLPLTLWEPETYRRQILREDRLLMLFYGMMLILIIYNLFSYFSIRHPSYIFYVFFIMFLLIFIMTQEGAAFQFLWPRYPIWANACIPLFLSLTVLFAFYFTRSFLQQGVTIPDIRIIIKAFIVITAVGVVASFAAFYPKAYMPMMAGTAIVAALGVAGAIYIAIRLSLKRIRAAYFYAMSWAGFLAGCGLFIGRAFGILPINFVTTWSILIGATLMVLLLSTAQADTVNTMRKELGVLSADLEAKVKDRTEELEAANSELEAINERLNDTNSQLEYAQKIAEIDIKMASSLQTSLMPRTPPEVAGWDLACAFMPMKGVSGDFYDFYLNNGGLYGISLCDVSGHGISSGLLTIMAKSILYRNFTTLPDLRLNSLVERVNTEILKEIQDVDYYLSGIFLRFSGDAVEYVNAGHVDMLARRGASGRVIRVQPPSGSFASNLLGIAEVENRFDVLKFNVERDDKLLLYTDGITESRNNEKEPFGEERLMRAFQEAPQHSARAIIDYALERFYDFIGSRSIGDDLTIIALIRK
ncbi:MAG: SpoIIE family protein phosphatase [Spirochaetes bacterium]|nr:SpoIIE family protein phosphatase [Spirochaetota bacterium]